MKSLEFESQNPNLDLKAAKWGDGCRGTSSAKWTTGENATSDPREIRVYEWFRKKGCPRSMKGARVKRETEEKEYLGELGGLRGQGQLSVHQKFGCGNKKVGARS